MTEDGFIRYFLIMSSIYIFCPTVRNVQNLLEAKVEFGNFIIRALNLVPEPANILIEMCNLIEIIFHQAESRDSLTESLRQVENDNHLKMDVFVQTWHRMLDGHQVFRSQRGLISLAGEDVKPGDLIWIVAGSYTPLALRRTTTELEFLFAGDIFMLDHMHGEILKDDYYGLRGKEQDFYIV